MLHVIDDCGEQQETILDASEDDQLQAAIRASLSENKRQCEERYTSSTDDSESEEGPDLFDSESESRVIGPQTSDGPKSTETNAATAAVSRQPLVKPQSEAEDEDKEKLDEELTNLVAKEEEDWLPYLGPESDPPSSIVFRYPNGEKEQWSIPSTSTIMVSRRSVPSDLRFRIACHSHMFFSLFNC